jgi:hypothetical protein
MTLSQRYFDSSNPQNVPKSLNGLWEAGVEGAHLPTP